MLLARTIQYREDHSAILHNSGRLAELKDSLGQGDVVIFKQVFSPNKLADIRRYLTQIGLNSLPNYHPIAQGAPNFHRINRSDDRSYVRGCFHQFSFFPWNQDLFDLFDFAKDAYAVRNLLSGLPAHSFLDRIPEKGCSARLSFQFYPKGLGAMNKHVDPHDFHQYAVPIVVMSKKGVDYQEGGNYVEASDGSLLFLDDRADIGDVIYFNAQIPHGVSRIDPKSPSDWTSFQGRWIMLIAINRVHEHLSISNSTDLEKA